MYLKLQFLCHKADVEVGGYGVAFDKSNLLYVDDFQMVKQRSTVASMVFDDTGLAEYFEVMSENGFEPNQFARLWFHTHPEMSANPSHTDETTFSDKFSDCSWAVMAILSKTNDTTARLKANVAGVALNEEIPWEVDWRALPKLITATPLDVLVPSWEAELEKYIEKPSFRSYNASGYSGVGHYGYSHGNNSHYRFDSGDDVSFSKKDHPGIDKAFEHLVPSAVMEGSQTVPQEEKATTYRFKTRSPIGLALETYEDDSNLLALEDFDSFAQTQGWEWCPDTYYYWNYMETNKEAGKLGEARTKLWHELVLEYASGAPGYAVRLPEELVTSGFIKPVNAHTYAAPPATPTKLLSMTDAQAAAAEAKTEPEVVIPPLDYSGYGV